MSRWLALLFAFFAIGTAALAADHSYPPVVTFAIYRNGENVGRHVITFEKKGDSQVVTIDTDITVRTLGVVAYRYAHHANEVWVGDQLQSLQAKTDDNGRKYTVSAQRVGANLKVEHTTSGPVATAAYDGFQVPDISREMLPGATLPTSQWNFRQVKQTTLLNTQFGTPARVTVTPAGRETVRTSTRSVEATRYNYTGDLHGNQWFDDHGRWVRGAFVAFDGSIVEYILQE